jgi:hypothetical protein
MKDNRLESGGDPLDRLLAEWKVTTALPPGFQENVWARIDRPQPRFSAWRQLLLDLRRAFARPSLAGGYVTALLAIGLAAGYWQARVTNWRLEQSLSARYVQMVDPYQHPHP